MSVHKMAVPAEWMKEYGGRPQPSLKCADRDGSCGHRSITDCVASRVKPVDRDKVR